MLRLPDQDVAPILATCIAAAVAAKDDPINVALQRMREGIKRDLEATVGDDLTKALSALARMKTAKQIDCDDYAMVDDLDEDTIDRVGELLVEVYLAGLDYILALPVRSVEDIGRKVELGLRYCDTDEERRQVLFAIAGFVIPGTVGTLPDVPAIMC